MSSSQPTTNLVTKGSEANASDQAKSASEFSKPIGQKTKRYNRPVKVSFDKKTVGIPKYWHKVSSEFYFHAKLSLWLYNCLENADFEFVELDSASKEVVAYFLNHTTFKALDPATDVTGFFRVPSHTLVQQNGEDYNMYVDYCWLEFTESESGSSTQVAKRLKTEKDLVMRVPKECFIDCVPSGSSWNKFIGFDECPEYIKKVEELKAKGYNVGNVELLPDHCKAVEWFRLCAQFALFTKWMMQKSSPLEEKFELVEIDRVHVQTEGGNSEFPRKENFYMTFTGKEVDKGFTAKFHAVVRRVIRDENGGMQIQIKCSQLKGFC